MKKVVRSQAYAGTIQVPPSKSDGQRALLCAALANGWSEVRGVGISKDEQHMLETIRRMGAQVEPLDHGWRIKGIDRKTDELEVHAGESGLGIRLLTPVCAALTSKATLSGEGSLQNRDLSFFSRYLPDMGVDVSLSGNSVPIKINGQLKGGNYTVDGSQSSQYISGLLMALPLCKEDSILRVLDLKSTAYVRMTLATLRQFGIRIEQQDSGTYHIPGQQKYASCTYQVEGDWSAASNWLVAAALGYPVKVAGLSMGSLQADKSLMSMLLHAKCRVTNTDEGIVVDGTNRQEMMADATDCPDLFPALVTYAALTKGTSRITGVHRLANKESDRGMALIQEFSKLGIEVQQDKDDLLVHGSDQIKGAKVKAHNDHRIAMCLAIAGMYAMGETEIDGAEAVAKSYPQFWDDLETLRAL